MKMFPEERENLVKSVMINSTELTLRIRLPEVYKSSLITNHPEVCIFCPASVKAVVFPPPLPSPNTWNTSLPKGGLKCVNDLEGKPGQEHNKWSPSLTEALGYLPAAVSLAPIQLARLACLPAQSANVSLSVSYGTFNVVSCTRVSQRWKEMQTYQHVLQSIQFSNLKYVLSCTTI